MSTQWQDIKPSDILTSEEQHRLRQRSNWMGAWLLLHAWGVIAVATVLFAFMPNIFTFFFGLIVIGSRQLGLAILQHEASHGMLFRSRALNDRLGQWIAASPNLIHMKNYRIRHMAHHRFTRTEKDPENYLYTPFPVSKGSMGRKILRDFTGIVFVRTHVGLFRFIWGERQGRGKRLRDFYGATIVFYTLFISAFAVAGRIDLFFLMWLLPLATTQQFFLRIRNIAEHAAVPDLTNPLKNTRTTLAGWLERMTFAPYYVNYHIEHHMVPFVPCWRLQEVHKIMLAKGFGPDMEISPGYADIIRLNAAA